MKALQILAREHAAIAALATRLEAEIDAALASGAIDGEAVDRLLLFFEARVDGQHQEKEERVLLPRLQARAGEAARAVGSIADDHALHRRLLAQMRDQVEGAAYAEPNSLAVLVRCARRYLHEQREHSAWEQAVMFPLAARLLSPGDDDELLGAFQRLDRDWGGLLWDEARAIEQWLDQRRMLVPA